MESSPVLFSLHQPASRSLTSVRLLFTIKFVYLRWVGLLRRTHFQACGRFRFHYPVRVPPICRQVATSDIAMAEHESKRPKLEPSPEAWETAKSM